MQQATLVEHMVERNSAEKELERLEVIEEMRRMHENLLRDQRRQLQKQLEEQEHRLSASALRKQLMKTSKKMELIAKLDRASTDSEESDA